VGSPRGLQAFVSTTPVVTWSVTRPLEAGRAASFSARISDPVRRATVVRSTWTWGDGTESAEGVAQASHTYEAPGTYTVTLTIVDSVGQTASRTRAVTVTR
jgi:PKD repeat protein